MATVRTYEPGDLDACRRLWQDVTEWHRRIYDNPGIGADASDLELDEHPRGSAPRTSGWPKETAR